MNKLIKRKKHTLTFYNYKEPLSKIPRKSGFGFYGVLLGTTDGEKVECHVCGKLFSSLHMHVNNAHKITIPAYKEKFGLARGTALISEKEREVRKNRTLEWIRGLSQREKDEIRRKTTKKFLEWKKNRTKRNFEIRLETKNKRGTCPDQLLEKIRECAKSIKRIPTKDDIIDFTGSQRYIHLIYKTFGSYVKAREMSGVYKGKLNNLGGRNNMYTDEELLEYLTLFHQENNRIPTQTDCRRGLIPASEVYKRHFGSLPQARVLAGIKEKPTRWSTK